MTTTTPNVHSNNKQPDSSWLANGKLDTKEQLILALYDLSAVCFGTFTLKSGLQSPIYIDLRLIISYPNLLRAVAQQMYDLVKDLQWQRVCGVPYTALPIATLLSDITQKGMIMKRKEGPKAYGMKRALEGHYSAGENTLIVEDLVTSGMSVMETVTPIRNEQLQVTDVVVLINREQGGEANLQKEKLRLHSVITITELLNTLVKHKYLTSESAQVVFDFVKQSQFQQTPAPSRPTTPATASTAAAPAAAATTSAPTSTSSSSSVTPSKLTYEQRLQHTNNAAAKQLLQTIIDKQSNLCVSLDVTDKAEFLRIADAVGPYTVLLKTHIDIINDYTPEFLTQVQQLATKHNFLLFEDRKFADIGNTVTHQYQDGAFKISSWSHITNAHILPGAAIIDGLKQVGLSNGRGLLLLAEMSSKGNLLTGEYTETAVKLAEANTDFVIGFIGQRALSNNPSLLVLTPGVNLASKGDALGQQYNTPESVIAGGTDVIIVGRGIIAAKDPATAAQEYQQQGWSAYQKRTKP